MIPDEETNLVSSQMEHAQTCRVFVDASKRLAFSGKAKEKVVAGVHFICSDHAKAIIE